MKITKIRFVSAMAIVVLACSCTQYTCPTYGSNYSYTPTKYKPSKSSGKKAKPVKRAEQ